MIVTKTEILWLSTSDEHDKIIKHFNLNDNTSNPNFAKVELIPKNHDYGNLKEYIFKIDQDFLPDWFDKNEVEIACRTELKKIMKNWKRKFPGDLTISSDVTLPALTSIGGYCHISSDVTFEAPLLKR